MSIFETTSQRRAAASAFAPAPSLATGADAAVVNDQSGVHLSPLGMHLELLRLERGLSKQTLARVAGTSRQQLWRVMTGKSELTSSLCARLASVLDVDSRTLSTSSLPRSTVPATRSIATRPSALDYLATEEPVLRTFATIPRGAEGLTLKRAFLDALDAIARRAQARGPVWLSVVRARLDAGEL